MVTVQVKRVSRTPNVQRSVTTLTARTAAQAKQHALSLTSGAVTTQQLAAMGHPFGRRAAQGRRRGAMRGTISRLPINRQTGRLQRSLRVITTSHGWRLQFTAPHSAFVLAPGGTSRMVARGFWSEMRSRLAPALRRELRQFYRS